LEAAALLLRFPGVNEVSQSVVASNMSPKSILMDFHVFFYFCGDCSARFGCLRNWRTRNKQLWISIFFEGKGFLSTAWLRQRDSSMFFIYICIVAVVVAILAFVLRPTKDTSGGSLDQFLGSSDQGDVGAEKERKAQQGPTLQCLRRCNQ